MRRLLVLFLTFLASSAWAEPEITSASHAANQGRIVFSREEIKFGAEEAEKFDHAFTSKDPIYGRIYLTQPLEQAPLYERQSRQPMPDDPRDGDWELLLFLDGAQRPAVEMSFARGRVSETVQKSWTTWQLNLAPDNMELRESHLADPWFRLVSQLVPGKHDVRIVFLATQKQYASKPLAEGRFELTVPTPVLPAAPVKTETQKAPSPSPPTQWTSFPTDTYLGSDLAEIKSAIKKVLASSHKPPIEVQEISVTSNWISGRYSATGLEYRRIQATVLSPPRSGRPHAQFSSYSFLQTKQGSGWSPLKFRGAVPGGPEGTVKGN